MIGQVIGGTLAALFLVVFLITAGSLLMILIHVAWKIHAAFTLVWLWLRRGDERPPEIPSG